MKENMRAKRLVSKIARISVASMAMFLAKVFVEYFYWGIESDERA